MSYYQQHVFFCCNHGANGEQYCNGRVVERLKI